MNARVPNVLSIAGSDPSGGAGIQMDLRVFAVFRVHGCAAVAALTAQNSAEVRALHHVPRDFLRSQLDAVFDGMQIDAVKIGMLGDAGNVEEVADVLTARRPRFVVVDPVLRATTGAELAGRGVVEALRNRLMPIATVITPNAAEAGALLGAAPPRTTPEAHDAAAQLVTAGARAALVKGGHIAGNDVVVDVLHDAATIHEFRTTRSPGGEAHGTGCALSAAIAALLALGRSLPDASAEAQRLVADAIARRPQGSGPLHF